jgi:hypothetical protein
MVPRFGPSLLVALLLTPAAAGCGSGAGTGAQVPAGLRGVPPDLVAIREGALAIYRQALAGDFDPVYAQLGDVEATWRRFKSRAESDGAPAAAVGGLEAAVVRLRWALTDRDDGTAVARAANEVTGAAKDLVSFYRPGVPEAAFGLDYLVRALAIDALRADLEAAARHADELAQAWGSVRPKVLERGGRRQSDAFDAAVDALRQAIGSRDAARVQAIANRGVELASEINAVLDG